MQSDQGFIFDRYRLDLPNEQLWQGTMDANKEDVESSKQMKKAVHTSFCLDDVLDNKVVASRGESR